MWATVLAVLWLHANEKDLKCEWELLERKAVAWLHDNAGRIQAPLSSFSSCVPRALSVCVAEGEYNRVHIVATAMLSQSIVCFLY